MRKNLITGLLSAAFVTTCSIQEGNAQANTSLSNLTSPTAINKHLLPDSNDTKDLGSGTFGWRSLYLNNSIYLRAQRFISGDADNNTLVGLNTGASLAGGISNTAIGFNAGTALQEGSHNTAVGFNALLNTTASSNNVAIGAYSLFNNVYGEYNIAIGNGALQGSIDGVENIGIGQGTGYAGTSNTGNTALGHYSLMYNTADYTTAVGYAALNSNTSGINNSAFGYRSLWRNTTGPDNTAMGNSALASNTTGESNTAIGSSSLSFNNGLGNTAIGSNSLVSSISTTGNTSIGEWSGYSSWTGGANTFVGSYATLEPTDGINATALGYEAYAMASHQVRIGNTSVVSIGGYTGWTNVSDGRFKKNLKENVPGLEFITKLRPVTYTLDMDGLDAALKSPLPAATKNSAGKIQAGGAPERKISAEAKAAKAAKAQIIQTGFVAQEVEKAAQDLGYNFSGVDAPKNSRDLYGLRYAEFVVPLVKAVQELNEQNAALEERVRKLEELILKNTAGNNTSVLLSGAKLEQNAPNPFNGNTIIGYTIPENEGPGRIVITDMKGSTIKAVNVNGKGRGQVTLSRGTLAAGEYIYSLWIGDRLVDSKRMSVK
jgi:hypothetical protein